MEIILPILIIIIFVMFGGVKTAPDKFSEGKILGADKKRINNALEELLRGGSLKENYRSLKKDLKSMTETEKQNLITKITSDENVIFSEKELGVIFCIIAKMLFDITTDMVEYSIADAMAKKVQTLNNFGSYYRHYEFLKLTTLDFGKGFMVKKLELMFNIQNRDDLLKFLDEEKTTFDKYLDSLKKYLSNDTELLEKLMTEVQEVIDAKENNKEKHAIKRS